MLQRMGIQASSGLQRVEGRESKLPSGEEGGVRVGAVMLGDGERSFPGEDKGQDEGLYNSKELTGEKVCGYR